MNDGRQQNRIQPADSQHAPGKVTRMIAEIQEAGIGAKSLPRARYCPEFTN
jgi:hypothetical protein